MVSVAIVAHLPPNGNYSNIIKGISEAWLPKERLGYVVHAQKYVTLSLLVSEFLAIFFTFVLSTKIGHCSAPAKKRTHTHGRAYACTHTTCADAHTRKRTRVHVNTCNRVQAYSLARRCTHTRAGARGCMHTSVSLRTRSQNTFMRAYMHVH